MMQRIWPDPSSQKQEEGRPSIVHITYIDAADQPDWSFDLHSHTGEVEFSLVSSGKGMVFCGGKFYPVKKGDLVIKNAEILHEERSDPASPIAQICIGYHGICSDRFGPDRMISDSIPPVIATGDAFPVLYETGMAMYRLAEKKAPESEEVLSDLSQAFLSLVRFITPQVMERGNTDPEMHVIDQVVDYLNLHYGENISLDALADRFYFSTSYLARKFRERVGYTVNQYLLKLRMGEAERLLVFSDDMSIKEIAGQCGYDDIHYFYATFRKYAGCAPGEFRTLYSNGSLRLT